LGPSMCPKRLHCTLATILTSRSTNPDVFTHLTHLELYNPFHEWDEPEPEAGYHCTLLAALPSLSHLAFRFPTFMAECPPILTACKSLSAFVLHCDFWDEGVLGLFAEDKRFVVMTLESSTADW
jgi:hypothetical protein